MTPSKGHSVDNRWISDCIIVKVASAIMLGACKMHHTCLGFTLPSGMFRNGGKKRMKDV